LREEIIRSRDELKSANLAKDVRGYADQPTTEEGEGLIDPVEPRKPAPLLPRWIEQTDARVADIDG
jgi:hypothetical protein